MKIAVLGAGIIGVCTAWWLRQTGHDVMVIDRRNGPGQETSFANGGQISISSAQPWATPQTPYKLLKWLFSEEAPLLFRPQLDWWQWMWGLAFLRECLPSRLVPNIRALVNMSEYSRLTLQTLRRELNIENDHLECGILSFYRHPDEFALSKKIMVTMQDLGITQRTLTIDEVIEIEPALAPHRAHIVGGDFTPGDESGDAHRFTVALATHCAAAGVAFHYATTITRFVSTNGRIQAIEVLTPTGAYEQIEADAFVVALGSDSPHLLRPLGVACNIYPTKGYSATFPIIDAAQTPTVSLRDSSHKVVFSRLGNFLRMAGTAELSGYSRTLNRLRCEAMTRLAGTLFPEALDFERVAYWSGLRPSTPSNVPLIGQTKIPNLYLNTGHGTLGWTMGVGSGRALADLLNGHRPEPEFPFLGR